MRVLNVAIIKQVWARDCGLRIAELKTNDRKQKKNIDVRGQKSEFGMRNAEQWQRTVARGQRTEERFLNADGGLFKCPNLYLS
jgi:hypothetical protein